MNNLGVNTKCFVCGKIISEIDVEQNNRPMRMQHLPGFVHRKCRMNAEGGIINEAKVVNINSEGIPVGY